MNWKPISQRGKEIFERYQGQFKVDRETASQVSFCNVTCDTSTEELFRETFLFGFWLYKGEDIERIVSKPVDDLVLKMFPYGQD